MLDPQAKLAAVNRIILRKSTALKEAARLQCDVRTIERAVAKEKKARGLVDPPATAPATAGDPPGERPAPEPPGNADPSEPGGEIPDIEKVKAAAAGGDKGPTPEPGKAATPPPPVDPVEDGKRRDADFVLRELRRAKGIAVAGAGLLLDVPLDDPVLEEEAAVSGLTEELIKDSPEEMAAQIRKLTGGSDIGLYVVLGLEVAVSGLAIWKRSRKLNPKRPAPKKEIDGEAKVKK